MGAQLSKFSLLGHIQSFRGVLVQEDQLEEESDYLSDESEIFYSDLYVYEDIVNIETDSNWVIIKSWLFYLLIVHLDIINKTLS